jgi:hypothetical protein
MVPDASSPREGRLSTRTQVKHRSLPLRVGHRMTGRRLFWQHREETVTNAPETHADLDNRHGKD